MNSSLTLVSGGTPEPRIFMLALDLPNFVILEGGITSSSPTSLDIALYWAFTSTYAHIWTSP